MSLLTTLLGSSGGGGGGSTPGVILSPVVAASTTALTVTYANGTAGVGATLTNAGAQAAISLDGVSPTLGQRVLIKDQASTLQNGVYVVTVVGTGATNWKLTRATDFDEPSEMQAGVQVDVVGGTVNAATIWVLTLSVAAVGTNAVVFVAASDAGYTASRALVTNSAGRVVVATTTSTEIGYVNGVTSAIQTQIDAKSGLGAVDQSTTPQTIAINTAYVANSGSLITFNIPATVAQGSTFEIDGYGAGGWLLQCNTGQVINLGSSPTTSAGSLASTNRYDGVKIRCTVANTTFVALSAVGNLTVV